MTLWQWPMDRLLDAIAKDPAYRLTEADFEDLGARLLELPLGDPLRAFWGAQRHCYLRNNPHDIDRLEKINRTLLEAAGLLQVEEIDLDW